MTPDPGPPSPSTHAFTVEVPLPGGGFLARSSAGDSLHLPFVLPGELVLPAEPAGPAQARSAGLVPATRAFPPVAAPPAAFPRVLSASPDRVPPPCPHFGPCGGCQYQHASYPAQLAFKRSLLLGALAASGITAPPEPHLHAADPWAYRNRIRLRLQPVSGTPAAFHLGYNRRSSNALLPITTCPIAAPSLLRAAQDLVALAPSEPAALAWLNATAELELFTLPDESRLQLSLLLHTPPRLPATQLARSFQDLCNALHRAVPQLAGAGATLLRSTHANSGQPRASRREAVRFIPQAWGAPGLSYPLPHPGPDPDATLPSSALWVSRGSFFQVNHSLLPRLLALAIEAAPPDPTASAWDLFAGAGLFTRALSRRFRHVTAVEGSPTATADLAAARLPNVRVVGAPVLSFLRSAVLDRDRPSLVLLDPPRAGLGTEAAALLARLAPPRITYVSCDPTSLARDLAVMLSSRYNLAELHLVDMFPQTCHLETVAVLHRF